MDNKYNLYLKIQLKKTTWLRTCILLVIIKLIFQHENTLIYRPRTPNLFSVKNCSPTFSCVPVSSSKYVTEANLSYEISKKNTQFFLKCQTLLVLGGRFYRLLERRLGVHQSNKCRQYSTLFFILYYVRSLKETCRFRFITFCIDFFIHSTVTVLEALSLTFCSMSWNSNTIRY